jgi:hypothetical protein
MKKLILGLAAAGLLAPAAQAQDAGAVFRPVGGWTADFGDDYCRIFRTFSDGQNQMQLALERTQPGGQTRIIMVGSGMSPFRGADQLGYNFLPGGNSFKARYIKSETADGKNLIATDPLFLMLSPPTFTPGAPPPVYDRAAEQETARGITGIAFGEGLTDPVRFETGSLRGVVATVQTCADGLLTAWGLDAEKHKTMTAAARLNPRDDGVLPQGTIPFSDFEKFLGNSNQARVMIGADGKPTSCTIYQPTLSTSQNNRICSLIMSRATFTPAMDAAGEAMASYWMGSPMFLGPPPRGGFRGG